MEERLLIPKIIKKVLPAVVSIRVTQEADQINPLDFLSGDFSNPKKSKKIPIGHGSGFIIDKSGLILTNYHVVRNSRASYTAIFNSHKIEAKILAINPAEDIAVLKIEGENFPTIKLGDSSRLLLGQTVIVIGNTLGAFRNTVSVGVISGLSRELVVPTFSGLKERKVSGLIQTDAAVNPGNSGGPLVDLQGRAVGMVVAQVLEAQSVGFAIPINIAKKVLERLKKRLKK